MLLGIDVGTSSCKVGLFENSGKLLADASRPYRSFYPHPGWVEQNPEDWWDAAKTAVRSLVEQSGVSPADIDGIGIDGQSWSAVAIGNDGQCLGMSPIWLDTRAKDLCTEVEQHIGQDRIFSVAGNRFRPNYSTPKILWYKRNLPELYNNTFKFLQSNSYIAYKLTSVFSQDVCQAYGLHFFDNAKLQYDASLAEEFGIDLEKFPQLYSCSAVVGTVTKEAAEACGLRTGIPVVAGGLDAACAALGAGVYQPGQTQEQSGQAGGMSICTDFPAAHPDLISSPHVVPGRWLLQGGTTGGAGVMRWLQQELWPDTGFQELSALAESVQAGSDGVIFLPYMSGERSPIWNPDAKGVFYGLGFDKKRAHLVRAAMEGVAFSLRHNLETAEAANTRVGTLTAVGGAANSSVWMQIKADVTGRTVEICSSDTGTVFGAAILAAMGICLCKDPSEMLSKNITVKKKYTPNPESHAFYTQQMGQYLKLLKYSSEMF